MAGWIVEACPIPNDPRTRGEVGEHKYFMTDNGAKDYIREMASRHYTVKVQTTFGAEPEIKMDHGQAIIWANT